MATAELGLVRRVERIWLLPPFKKALSKREREKALLEQLDECVEMLFSNPSQPGLNLETLFQAGRYQVLSARITQSCRVILVQLAKSELGLLYFDSNHDDAYKWATRNRAEIPTKLTKHEQAIRGVPVSTYSGPAQFVQFDEDVPLALTAAKHFHTMVDHGVARYLTYLDDEQRRIAELTVRDLLLVKGGAGTGKTAVALHRALALAAKPTLPGVEAADVLYLCYNALLARAARQLLEGLYAGPLPETIEVQTFHTWCLEFLECSGVPIPRIDEDACQQAVYRAFGRLTLEQREALREVDGRFVNDEIIQVIKHNGLTSLEGYLQFSRDRRTGLKRPGREAVWATYELAREYERERDVCRYSDVPLLALQTLETMPEPPQCRAVIIDEGQDCSPVMIRLARRLLAASKGSLTVFADPAQEIYECGFHWTQKELRPSGGNVRWLRKTYRTTREIFYLARPLLDGDDDLQEDLAQLEAPVRHGPRPTLLVTKDPAELHSELVERIANEMAVRPPEQIGVLAADWDTLKRIGAALERHNIPASPAERGAVQLTEPTVKLLTMKGVKGLDFPSVFVVGPRRGDLGGVRRADLPGTRRTFYVALTRASEQLTIGMVDNAHHPLLELLDDGCYEAVGSQARSFVNLRGVAFAADGQVAR